MSDYPFAPSVDHGIEGEPGYCNCCGEYHLLKRRRLAALAMDVDLCRYCGERREAEISWHIARFTGQGRQQPPPSRRLRWRERGLAAALAGAGADGAPGLSGFAAPRYSLVQRTRMAWWRMRGRI